MSRIATIWAIVLAFALAFPAQAQWTGTRTGPRPANAPDTNKSDADRARMTMHGFAQCVIGVSRARVMEYLETFPETAEANKRARALSRNDCLAADLLSFDEKLFRWSVYDVLYNTDIKDRDPKVVIAAPATDWAAMSATITTSQRHILGLREMGECSVRSAPVESAALVRSQIGTKGESDAIKAVVPYIGACVDQNMKLEFSKSVLRGILAEALYTLAMRGPQSGSAEGGR